MRNLVGIALLVGATAAVARTDERPLAGQVVDETTGAGIPGAVIASGADAVETADDGRFALPAGTAGELLVIAPGYATARVDAGAAGRITLHRDGDAIEIIEITGKAPDPASPTAYRLGREQIRALPGSANDVLRALQSLPGVARTSFGIGGLVLRGAAPHESNTYLDGIEVPLAFHFGGVSSFYPSTLLDDVVLTPGGSDVGFGRGIGGVVELNSRAARRDQVRAGAEIGVFDASAYGEAPLAGGGVALGLRRAYADVILGRLLPEDTQILPRYYDGQVRWDRPLAGGTLSVLGFGSHDRLDTFGGSRFAMSFARAAVRYRRDLGRSHVSVTPWAGWGQSELGYVVDTPTRDNVDQREVLERRPLGLRADLRRDTAWGHVAAGVDLAGADVHYEKPTDILEVSEDRETRDGRYLDAGAWIETRIRLLDGAISLKPGLRADHLGIDDTWVIEPRIVATHELTRELTVREMIGLYHQPPPPIEAAMPEEDRDDGALRAGVHASLGARLALPDDLILSLTVYGVDMRVPRDGSPAMEEGGRLPLAPGLGLVIDNLIGKEFGGRASTSRRGWGAELSAQRKVGRWLMWASYTFAHTEDRPRSRKGRGWAVEDLDQRHNLNAVVSVRLGGWQLGARLRYVTGLPYTPIDHYDTDSFGFLTPAYGAINSARMPDFVTVDARVDRAWPRSWGTIGAFVDVQNVTDHDNVEDVSFASGSTRPTFFPGLPLLPFVGLSYTPPD